MGNRVLRMAIKRSLADNHLSELASKGRRGDTEIARTSAGELWHVNPTEKALMDLYGKEGEKMVDIIGSGTINPETGLEEKAPVTLALTAATFAYGAFQSGSAAEDQAKMERRVSEEAKVALSRQEEAVEKGYGAKKASGFQDYSMNLKDLSQQTGIAQEDLNDKTSEAIRKSGLATSGSITEKQSTMWKRIQGAFGRGRKSLLSALGTKMGEIEGWYESEKARISSEKRSLQASIDFAKEREESWYLGKNIKKFFG